MPEGWGVLFIGILSLIAMPIPLTNVSNRSPVQTCTAPSGRIQRLDQTLLIDGNIDKSLYDCFQKLFDANVRRVEVRSAGGDPHFAISIAEELSRIRPVVAIKEFCGSACAFLILPTASKIESEGISIVMFHNTSTSSLESMDGSDDDHGDLEKLSRREISLYQSLGVDEWLLTGPFMALNPICSITGSGSRSPGSFESHWKAVVLERSLLNRLRIRLPEGVVDTPAKLMDYAGHLPDRGSALLRGGIRFLSYAPGSDKSSQPLAAPKIPVLPPCDQPKAREGDGLGLSAGHLPK